MSLSFGSSACAMFELPDGTMFLPFSVGSSMDCESKKSLPQPRFGQSGGWLFGTWQNLDSIVACGTWRSSTLNPIFSIWFCHDSAVLFAGSWLSPIIVSGGAAGIPAFLAGLFLFDLGRPVLFAGSWLSPIIVSGGPSYIPSL